MSDIDLTAEVLELKRRVSALEEMLFRTHRIRKAIDHVVNNWPGPFTVQEIEKAIREFHAEVWREMKPYAVSNAVRALEKTGVVIRLNDGKGCNSAMFQRTRDVPDITKRPGKPFNRQAPYESGFRAIVRKAIDDLPSEFTLADLRAWMDKNMPTARIPYGSWSSTLYKLTQSQELICTKGRGSNCSAKRKAWTRGPMRVAPSGEELRDIESAWSEFRKSMAPIQESTP